MSIAAVSLLVLCLVIFLGYKTKVNMGILGVGAAFILGFFVYQTGKNGLPIAISSATAKAHVILGGWNSNLFLIIAGVSLLFSIARVNGTLDIVTRKAVALTKGNRKLLPIMIFIIASVISAIGPGNLATVILLFPICGAMAQKEDINPLLLILAAHAGSNVGGISPITPTGIIGTNVAMTAGVDIGNHLFYNMAFGFTLLFVCLYFVFGGWKLKPKEKTLEVEENVFFSKKQSLTLGVILLMIVAVVIGKLDVGLCAFVGSAILLVLHAADEKSALLGIPWSTLIMVCGVGVLVNVINAAGGIALLTDVLGTFMDKDSAAPIFLVTGSLLALVSSASGVVMPTLIPAAIQLAAKLGMDPSPIIASITLGAHFAATSPFCPAGGLMLSFAGENVDKQKLFVHLMIVAAASVIGATVLVALKVIMYL